MRTSLNEIELIDDHLSGRLEPGEQLLFEAKVIVDPKLADDLYWQRRTLALVKLYGRKTLRAEIESVHQQLFSQPAHQSFRHRILKLFR